MRRKAAPRWLLAVSALAAVILAGCSTSTPRRYESPAQVQRLRSAELAAVRVGALGDPARARSELAEARVALLVAIDENAPEERQRAPAQRVGEAFVATVATQERPTPADTAEGFTRALGGSSTSACLAMADAALARWDAGVSGVLVAAGRMDAAGVAQVAADLRQVAVGCSRAPGEQPRG